VNQLFCYAFSYIFLAGVFVLTSMSLLLISLLMA
jgi:hypothetical protein